ncbi:nuclear transport factor 2 family protein [Halalkalibacter akibai]|uniref:Putative steroid delta-isomerase domain protein n=1 Tax=Halalkalibacter akibai (strain ATCC 43226 / DSM 21942 / CIP 109018 / JCM 9157 / 1139) TaxID=1236973 RepID=W4QSV4_HALA3|nr:nuclear transport factor 2 family protein [Halalkalibacter akibai]GAE34967.1 putative steroid delta-isomerase domain protein [Halalkalibacter akibai JCM 9157]
MTDISIPAKKQLEAYNNRDIDAFMQCYTEDCVVEDGEGNILMTGAAAMRERYAKLFEESPELHCKLVSRIVVGNYVLDEENVTGSRGSSEMSHVVAVYRVTEDGLISHVRFLR